jgi:nicotinamide-nucleotide amidase
MKPANLIDLARRKGAVIATAESCTGGLISGAITEIPGSSDVFDRGFVTYSNAAKIEMLGVSGNTIDEFGAVSEEVAREMAQGAVRNSLATIAVSVTGIAGPGGSDSKPEGRVCFGIAGTLLDPHSETEEFGPLGRAEVRKATTAHALDLLFKALS